MKKILVVCTLLLVICGCNKNKVDKKEETIKKHATDYYETFMQGVSGRDEAVITLKDLKDANKNLNKSYDLKDVEECEDNSEIKLSIKKGTNKVTKYKYNLKCKK
jgi:hypothetical protein